MSLLLVGILASVTHAKNLRSVEKGDQKHRKLAQFQLPFDISWRIAIGNGQSDRQPTAAERLGVVDATIGWLEANIENIYGSTTGLQFTDFQATLNTGGTTWTPGAAVYPHIININCLAIWDADLLLTVPDNEDFVLALNEAADVREFIVNYLLVTGPDDSLYHFSERVNYALSTSTPEGPLAPTMAPVANPAPTISSSFPSAFVIPFRLDFGIGMGSSFTYRTPAQQEWKYVQCNCRGVGI